jgi:excisionase family DNA binding protein
MPNAPSMPQLHSIAEVAEACSTSEYSIRKLISDHEIEAVKIGQRGLRIPHDALIDYLERNRIKAAANARPIRTAECPICRRRFKNPQGVATHRKRQHADGAAA